MPGLEQTPPLRKKGLHSSPTGELFLNDVRCGIDWLLGGEQVWTDAADVLLGNVEDSPVL